jgi:aspartyl-tRNA(Asn)/glutamyl-tRNA(Gln) amidotransferase subunit A
MPPDLAELSATATATRVRRGELSAAAVVEAALARIEAHNPVLNAFTDITAERASRRARAIDAARARGDVLGPLAGVPSRRARVRRSIATIRPPPATSR